MGSGMEFHMEGASRVTDDFLSIVVACLYVDINRVHESWWRVE